jgi:hypothetical protein
MFGSCKSEGLELQAKICDVAFNRIQRDAKILGDRLGEVPINSSDVRRKQKTLPVKLWLFTKELDYFNQLFWSQDFTFAHQ